MEATGTHRQEHIPITIGSDGPFASGPALGNHKPLSSAAMRELHCCERTGVCAKHSAESSRGVGSTVPGNFRQEYAGMAMASMVASVRGGALPWVPRRPRLLSAWKRRVSNAAGGAVVIRLEPGFGNANWNQSMIIQLNSAPPGVNWLRVGHRSCPCYRSSPRRSWCPGSGLPPARIFIRRSIAD